MSLLHVNAQLTAIAGPSGERYDSDGAGTSRLPQPIDAYSTVIRSLAGGDTGGAVAENVLIVATADACSASRPGARRESLERYIKRMEELE